MSKRYEWIVVDFDGTLVDSLEMMYNAYSIFMKSHGLKPTRKEFEKLNGPTLNEIIFYLKEKHDLKEKRVDLLFQYEEIIRLSYLSNVKLFEGRKELLESLKNKGYKIGLVTSATKDLVLPFLKKNKINSYFDITICGDNIEYSKPHPEIYNTFTSKIADPNSVIVLEDSKNGIQSAKEAGLQCFNVTGKTSPEILSMIEKT